jgi:hypothetical protein
MREDDVGEGVGQGERSGVCESHSSYESCSV